MSTTLWFLAGAIAFIPLWCAGSFVYLKLRYRARHDHETPLPFSDLDKEQASPRFKG